MESYLKEMLKDYCVIDELRILKVSDINVFFAVKGEEALSANTMMRYLREKEVEILQEDPQMLEKLYTFKWRTLACYERMLIEDPKVGSLLAEWIYRLGTGRPGSSVAAKNDVEAARLYEIAANAGHFRAMVALASMYSKGRDVAKDKKKAIYWVTRAGRHAIRKIMIVIAVLTALVWVKWQFKF